MTATLKEQIERAKQQLKTQQGWLDKAREESNDARDAKNRAELKQKQLENELSIQKNETKMAERNLRDWMADYHRLLGWADAKRGIVPPVRGMQDDRDDGDIEAHYIWSPPKQ